MITLKQGTIEERVSELTLGAGLSITQDASGLATLDISGSGGITQAFADARYVLKAGDTMTGQLTVAAPLLNSGSSMARFQGAGGGGWTGASGLGVEIYQGGLQSYNRSTAAYGPMQFDASQFYFMGGGGSWKQQIPGYGYLRTTPGAGSTTAGYIEWFSGADVRQGYMGYTLPGINLTLEVGDFAVLGTGGISYVFSRTGGVTFNIGPLSIPAGFTSYVADGIWGAGAIPAAIFSTPGGAGRQLVIGYSDSGGGQYTPAIGIMFNAVTALRVFRLLKSGDANDMFDIYSNGTLVWGPGTGAIDTSLSRLGVAGLLLGGQLQSDGGIRATGWFSAGVSGLGLEIGISGGGGFVYSYNRTSSVFAPIVISGTDISLTPQGGQIYTYGNVVVAPSTVLSTTSGDIYIRAYGVLRLGAGNVNEILDITATGAVLNQNTAVSPGTASTYGFRLYYSSNDRISIGADGTYSYIQSWVSQPLYLNSQGNAVYVGTGGLVVYGTLTVPGISNIGRLETSEIRATGASVGFQISSGTVAASYDNSGSWTFPYNVITSANYTGPANKGILIGNSYFGQLGGNYGEVGYNNTDGSGASKYLVTDSASRIRFTAGGFAFSTAPGGTAGAAITFTDRMTFSQAGVMTVTGSILSTTFLQSSTYTRVGTYVYLDGNVGSSIVGAYDPTKYQGVYSMGSAYALPLGGTSVTGFYGLTWIYDYLTTYINATGVQLEHSLVLYVNGSPKSAIGMNGMWTAGIFRAVGVITGRELRAGLYAGGGHLEGDITARRSATTGVYYFGDYTDRYLYYDGTKFILSGGGLTIGGTAIAGDFQLA